MQEGRELGRTEGDSFVRSSTCVCACVCACVCVCVCVCVCARDLRGERENLCTGVASNLRPTLFGSRKKSAEFVASNCSTHALISASLILDDIPLLLILWIMHACPTPHRQASSAAPHTSKLKSYPPPTQHTPAEDSSGDHDTCAASTGIRRTTLLSFPLRPPPAAAEHIANLPPVDRCQRQHEGGILEHYCEGARRG